MCVFFFFFFFFLQYTGIEMVNILKSTLSIPVQIFSKTPPPPPVTLLAWYACNVNVVCKHRPDFSQFGPLPCNLNLVLESPAKNRFFHRNLADWVSWEREFKKKENGSRPKMSSRGKNITECLFYCVACLHKFHVPVCNFLVINRVLQAHKWA